MPSSTKYVATIVNLPPDENHLLKGMGAGANVLDSPIKAEADIEDEIRKREAKEESSHQYDANGDIATTPEPDSRSEAAPSTPKHG